MSKPKSSTKAVAKKLTAAEYNAALIDLAAACQNDPRKFIETAFPWGEPGPLLRKRPRQWLLKVCDSIKEKIERNYAFPEAWATIREATASGHGIGKSAGMAQLILWAITTMHTRGVVTANTDHQLRTKTWTELRKWHALSIFRHWFTVSATAIKHAQDETWRIDAVPWSAHNTEAFAGLHNEGKRVLLGFDEASGIDDPVWETAEGAMTDALTQIVWIAQGNPTRASGRFRQCWTKFREFWSVRNVDSRTVEDTNKAEFERWGRAYGEDSQFFNVRVKGEFVDADKDQLIALQWISEARLKGQRFAADGSLALRRLSVDVQSGGEDASIFTVMHHYDSVRHLTLQAEASYDVAMGAVKSAEAAGRMFDAMKADANGVCDIVVDAIGVGDGCAGTLINEGKPVVVYKGGAAASDPLRFRNTRVQCYYLLRNDLRDGRLAIAPDALPDEQAWKEFEEQLCSIRVKHGAEKLEDLETKDEMLRRGVKSPDRADSLAMQYAHKAIARLASESAPQVSVAVIQSEFRSEW